MEVAALCLMIVGAWLLDSAVKNRAPIKTLETILRNPSQARATVKNATGSGYATSGTAGGPSQVPSGVASSVISFARQQIGKPYAFGTAGPNSYDCSGLVYAAFKQAGISIPRSTVGQILIGQKVNKANLEPGDLVFPDAGHVQIYTGNGMVVEAPRTGEKVREVPMWGFFTARRVTDQPKQKASETVNSSGAK